MNRSAAVRRWVVRLAVFVFGIFVSAFGVALSTKSNLGISPLSLPAYVLSGALPLTMGQLVMIQNGIFMVAQIVLLRRDYSPINLLQLVMAMLYGGFVDISLELLSGVDATFYPLQLLLCLLSVVVMGFGVFLTVKANVIILAGEGIVCAIARVTGQEFGRMKVAVDCSMLALGSVLSLVLFHSLVGLREGTVISALTVGLVVRQFNRQLSGLDRLWTAPAEAGGALSANAAPAKPHLVITISREFGPHGVRVAHAIAEQLNLKLYDEELVELAIQESGLDPDFVRRNEERLSHGVLYDLYAQNFEYLPGQQTADELLFQAQSRVIRRLAEQEDCIILGRCANAILGRHPGYFHVYLHEDLERRLSATMEEFGLSRGAAKALIERTDAERRRRYRYHTGHPWGQAEDYDLCLDISAYGAEVGATLLSQAVRNFVYSDAGRNAQAPSEE